MTDKEAWEKTSPREKSIMTLILLFVVGHYACESGKSIGNAEGLEDAREEAREQAEDKAALDAFTADCQARGLHVGAVVTNDAVTDCGWFAESQAAMDAEIEAMDRALAIELEALRP